MQLQFTIADCTLREVLEFVLANKRDKLFRFFSDIEILAILHKASVNRCLYIVKGGSAITGMVIARKVSDKVFRVDHLLCTTKEAFLRIRKMGRQIMDGRVCKYTRRGQSRTLKRY